MRRILFLARAEVLHIVRDRTTMAQILVVPIVQLLVLVNAATFIVRDTRTWIVDNDRTVTSRGLIERFKGSGRFTIVAISSSVEPAYEALLRGDASLVLTIPRELERRLVREHEAPLQIELDAVRGAAAGIVQSYVSTIVARYSQELGRELRLPGRPTGPRIEIHERGWYNPQLNYKHYMVPGVLVALVTLIATLLAAQNIAREKELGTLEQLNVTPITRTQFIAGKLLPLWVLGLVDLAVGLVVGKLVFQIPIRGSLLLLFGAAAIYLVVALAIGLLVSTIVETQQQAMFVTFFIVSAYFLLSGLFTPVDSMAHWVQIASVVNPVRHFVTISRAILLKGATFTEILRPLGTLVAFAVVTLSIAVLRYRKTTH